MKHYEALLSLGCFTLDDVKQIVGNIETAKTICKSYLKKRFIDRVKRDLYVAISLETKQPVATRYQIASHISESATVSYHSALEYYGYANQVFNELYVMSNNRFVDFSFDGVLYRRVSPFIHRGITQIGKVNITTLERTVIDCIHSLNKTIGLEELLRCISLIPALDEDRLLSCLTEYNNSYLYQKTGCILSQFASELGLNDSFFAACQSHLPKGKTYMLKGSPNQTYHNRWRLYASSDFFKITDKGVAFNGAN